MVIAAVAALGVMFSWPRGVVTAPTHAAPAATEKARCLMVCVSPAVNSMSVPGRCLSVSPAASILAIGPSVAETLLGMYQRGVFGYAIAVYLLIAGISQILSRRLNARHSLLFGCTAQVLAAVVFAAAIQWHSTGLAAAGLVVAGYAYGAIFVGSATW